MEHEGCECQISPESEIENENSSIHLTNITKFWTKSGVSRFSAPAPLDVPPPTPGEEEEEEGEEFKVPKVPAPEPKPDPKPDPKQDPKQDPKPDPKQDPKPDPKPQEPKTEEPKPPEPKPEVIVCGTGEIDQVPRIIVCEPTKAKDGKHPLYPQIHGERNPSRTTFQNMQPSPGPYAPGCLPPPGIGMPGYPPGVGFPGSGGAFMPGNNHPDTICPGPPFWDLAISSSTPSLISLQG
ncbi:unnamed protein product [Nesidiocoris tenuis]|uniref:Uncharacterized protein n=1 Tax=Nesidiocoris tenuis TaxID=355587 RepID=A0A6H5FZA9_9HEMI|nr:unnamed protein product [Nesidiocoris tenuis]